MSSLAERLRGVVGPPTSGRAGSPAGLFHDVPARSGACVADALGGWWHEARGQRYLVVDRAYSASHRHGAVTVGAALPPSAGIWPRLSMLAGGACGSSLLFLDLETTGLAGGAGTYAFLVGCAWFEGGGLRVRQFFLSDFSAERALLSAVADLAGPPATIVTYNGKSFDLPLIETRFLYHRLAAPFSGMSHIDMLHASRRLWREEDDRHASWRAVPAAASGSCRLTAIEQTICGVSRSGDVPGFEIPSRYFEYVRTGQARQLHAVFEHNRLDLISLALLTARAGELLESGPAAGRTAREALGLGRLYERGGLLDEALACYSHAAGAAPEHPATHGAAGLPTAAPDFIRSDAIVAEALRSYALLCRRQRRHDEAAATWKRALGLRRCPSHIVREAAHALAVHHEHRLCDPGAARNFALRSMPFQETAARREALQHRLARLARKLGEAQGRATALF